MVERNFRTRRAFSVFLSQRHPLYAQAHSGTHAHKDRSRVCRGIWVSKVVWNTEINEWEWSGGGVFLHADSLETKIRGAQTYFGSYLPTKLVGRPDTANLSNI